MRVSVTFRHMDNSDALRKYAEDKIGKLNKYVYSPVDASVVLSVEKHRQIAEVVINAERMTIKGREATEDMYSAIDMVMEKIEKQIKKHKERLVSHKSDNSKVPIEITEPIPIEREDNDAQEGEEPTIITKTLDSKPMTVDEAAMQLDMSNSDFLVFINADTREMNVIYRRKDNNFGHIIPRTTSI
jgi:putative sigma-54 modulation protein